jgi:hypothetical protein
MLNRVCKRPVSWVALLACSWLVAPIGVFADGTGPDARTLGIAEGILSYCSKVDPTTAAEYQERVKQLVQGASDEALAKVRSSEEYQRARASLEDFVSKVDEHNVKRVCSNGVAAQPGVAAHH